MSRKFTLNWETDDGYIGKSRPQHTTVTLNDFDEDMTVEDIEHELEILVEEDFREKITYYVSNLSETAREIKTQLRSHND